MLPYRSPSEDPWRQPRDPPQRGGGQGDRRDGPVGGGRRIRPVLHILRGGN